MTQFPDPPPAGSAVRTVALGLLLPLGAGAACVLAFAPFYAWPAAIAALALLFATWAWSGSPRQAALSGYAFGLGYFLTGVSWIYVSLHDYGEMHAILAGIATFLFCAYLALFPAITGWLAVRWGGGDRGRRLAFAAALFPAAEWLRGTLFTGFPWLTIGTSQAPASPLAGFAPWVGGYGVSLAVTAAAALVAGIFASRARAPTRLVLAAALAALFGVGLAARLPAWTEPDGAPISMALLQGNIAQEMKWRDEVRLRTLALYRDMIEHATARVVVVPETALPAFLDQLPDDYLEALRASAKARGQDILLGTVERTRRDLHYDYYNSVVRITGEGAPSYRKRHLVAFGEYIPPGFAWVLTILHIPLSDFSRGVATQPPIEAGGTRFAVAICYEDMYGDEVADALPAAGALVNVSNDAWFGHSLEQDQHLQASQMRALETGRWMVRSTNTGATAAIDEHGQVLARLPAFERGTLTVDIVPRRGATPFVRWGNSAALGLMALAAVGAHFARRRGNR